MNPYLIAGGLAAFLLYEERDKLFGQPNNTTSARQKEPSDFFNDFFNGGGQPATGNGQNNSQGWSNAVTAGVGLLNTLAQDAGKWWGNAAGNSSSSTNPANDTGYKLTDENSGWGDSSGLSDPPLISADDGSFDDPNGWASYPV